ncbi:Ankyrin_repeat-containing protein [Hexamita inflata]|uniref:Ankyrin repeat-containing protein n=1 Tax=Hexamita inflata TaxID=28002 RepID=A0AA86Q4E6_9EUKA|nr:Ankyrin repeat-containing protein [Hexamita inflata]
MQWFEASRVTNPAYLKKFLNQARTRDVSGWTALMHAASSNNIQNIRYLLETEQHTHSPANFTALMAATEKNCVQAVQLLICQAGQRVITGDPRYKTGTTALTIAAENCNRELFEILWNSEKEAADMTDVHQFAFLHLAGHINSQPLKLDILGRSPVFYAVFVPEQTQSYKQMLKKLMIHPDAKRMPAHDKYGLTPLHYAVIYENIAAVRVLCQYYAGYGTNSQCKAFKLNTTALMLACQIEHVEIASILSKYEASLQDCEGKSALELTQKQIKMSASQRQRDILDILKSEIREPQLFEVDETNLEQMREKLRQMSTEEAIDVLLDQLVAHNTAKSQLKSQRFSVSAPDGLQSFEESSQHLQIADLAEAKSANNVINSQVVMSPKRNLTQSQSNVQNINIQRLNEAESLNTKLQAEVSEMKYVIAQLNTDVKLREYKIEELEYKLTKTNESFDQNAQQFDEVQIELSNLRQLYTQTDFDFQAMKVKFDAQSTQFEKQLQNSSKLQKDLNDTAKELNQALNELEKTQTLLSQTQSELQLEQQNLHNAENTIVGLTVEVEELQNNLQQKTDMVLFAEQMRDNLLSENQFKDEQLNETEQRLLNEVKVRDIKITEYQETIKNVQKRIKSLEIQIQGFKQIKDNIIEETQQDLTRSKIILEDISQSKKLEQSARLTQSTRMEGSMFQNIDNIQEQSQEAQKQIQELKSTNKALLANYNTLQQEYEETTHIQNQQIDQLQTELESKYQQIDELELQIEKMTQQQAEDNQSKQNSIMKDYDKVQDDFINLQVQVELKDEQILQLNQKQSDLSFEIEMLQGQIIELQQVNQLIREDTDSLSNDKLLLEEKLYNALKTKDNILDELAEAKSELFRINQSLEGFGENLTGVQKVLKQLKLTEQKLTTLKERCKEWVEKMAE